MKILLVGLGSIGKKHVNSIHMLDPDAEIFALRSEKDSQIYPGVINIFNLSEIRSNDIDFAIIANPTSEHKKVLSQLVDFGFPLFIEKPLYSTLDIEEYVNIVRTKGILSYVACNLRFLDCLKFVKTRVNSKEGIKLNEVNVYCGSYLPEWRPETDFRKTYSTIPELGGGVHLDLIHEIDYVYWIFGSPIKATRNFRSQSNLSIPSYDYANYLLDYDGFCASIILNYYRRENKRSLELVFEDETWNIDLLKNQVNCNDNIIFNSEQRITDTYYDQMKYFIKCINTNIDSFNTVSDAFNVLKICLEK